MGPRRDRRQRHGGREPGDIRRTQAFGRQALNRDVIFLADDDEEQGGSASIKLVIDKYWDKIGCAFAINEGGRVVLKDGKVQYVGIQASEKVPTTSR